MRMSTIKGDTGYSKAAVMYDVYLDGEKLHNCFTADEELGEAHCYADNDLEMIVKTGKVELIKQESKK